MDDGREDERTKGRKDERTKDEVRRTREDGRRTTGAGGRGKMVGWGVSGASGRGGKKCVEMFNFGC